MDRINLSFGGLRALSNLSFEVFRSEIFGLIGPNESGKTSLLNCINNFYKADSGHIHFDGHDITQLSSARIANLGVAPTFQNLALFNSLTVLDNIKVRGRMVQRIDIKGKRFFPIDVEEVLGTIPELGYEYQIILDKPKLERLKLKAEYRPEAKDARSLAKGIGEALYKGLGVESEVELVPKGSIGRVLFKAQRVISTYGQN